MDNPNKFIRNKGKDQLEIPKFENSSIEDFHSIQDSVCETNFEKSLLKSKTESDIKNTKLNPSGLESYILDCLWQNLQSSEKNGARKPTFQNFEPYIPPVVQNPPAF